MDKEKDELQYTKLKNCYAGSSYFGFTELIGSLISWRNKTLMEWTSWSELGASADQRLSLLLDDKKIVSFFLIIQLQIMKQILM